MEQLRKRDFEAMVRFLGDAQSALGPGPFTTELLDGLASVIQCDYAGYNELDFARRRVVTYVQCSAEDEDGPEMDDWEWDELVAELMLDRGAERGGIVKMSDHFSRAQRECFEAGPRYPAELGIIDTMCVRIGPPGARFVLNSLDRDFDGRDRLLMNHLQPHLFKLWDAAFTRRRFEAALIALDRDDAEGVLFIGARGDVEFASASAQRLLNRHFDTSSDSLPVEIATWYRNGRDIPLATGANGSNLVIRAVEGGAVLLLHEEPTGVSSLTRRETEVMRCVAAGLSNEEIGRRLWIEVPTVRKHLEHIYDKLGVRSRTAAIAKLRLVPADILN
jgi:DNA-binding CsgD family transcriptional regulator